jgi:hypothetical protein
MRARNLKPGFFKNEELAQINALGRILFEGLWCLADRKGRLEDRPQRIKIEILPYDDCNINDLLVILNEKKFITRYSVNGNKYIEINAFLKHQTPHWQEKDSIIPALNPIQDKPKRKPKTILDKPKCNPSDSFNLTPDSFNLTPDSLFTLFNETCSNLPQITELTESRKQKTTIRLKKHPEKEWWLIVFQKADGIYFTSKDGGNWRPSFDWLIENDKNALKVYEGNYDKQKHSGLKSWANEIKEEENARKG